MNNQYKIDQAIRNKNQRIDTFVDRREKSIAYFSSVKAAIEMVNSIDKDIKSKIKQKTLQEYIIVWRDWFYEEWCGWYLNNIVPTKDTPHNVSAASTKRIKNWVKEEQGQEHNFNQKEAEINQEIDSNLSTQPE